MESIWSVGRCLMLLCLVAHAATATVLQNALYSDDMMLVSGSSYDVRPFVSGFTSTAGEAVSVTFMGHTYNTTSSEEKNDENSTVGCPTCAYNWEVQMNTCYGASKNHTLVVRGASNTLTYTNVACGQVYLCSGQSNMELTMDYVDGGAAIAHAFNYSSSWRLFRVAHGMNDVPQLTVNSSSGGWQVATEELVQQFSATCFLTARHLEEILWNDSPFGLIWSAWGGTRVEAWTPDTKAAGCAPTAPEGKQQASAVLYNAMIHPLSRYSVRGAFWFQGTRPALRVRLCFAGGTAPLTSRVLPAPPPALPLPKGSTML